jgi:hypothetical protein
MEANRLDIKLNIKLSAGEIGSYYLSSYSYNLLKLLTHRPLDELCMEYFT